MNKVDLSDIKIQLDRIEKSIAWQKPILTFDEAAEFTGLSKSYIYKLTAFKKIPHYKPAGKMIYFNREELEEWLLRNRINIAEDIGSKAQSYCMSNKIGERKK